MAKRSKKVDRTGSKVQGYVVVTFAEDWDQAREYEALLKGNEIPVAVEEHSNDSVQTPEIAIMVPDDYLDEAHVIIESQEAYDDFYDLADDDFEGGDFGDDYFDDGF